MNYYNEFDPFAAEWLKALIKQGLIPNGEVDTRSIVDVRPDDLRQFKQCHFFAGIGGWSHAMRLAGWDDDRQIWTGSCPCQPFSVAGKGKGQSDERHLWPAFFELIRQVRPPVVMGEQVAGKAGYGWFDGVASDLEGENYACRAVDIPACAVNAPHIRQRLYWVAVDNAVRGRHGDANEEIFSGRDSVVDASGLHSSVVDPNSSGQREYSRPIPVRQEQPGVECSGRDAYPMAYADSQLHDGSRNIRPGWGNEYPNSRSGSFWSEHEWLTGADGKTRRSKPGVRLLVNGVPNRVGRLRGYGNAIVPPLAAEVIRAFMETEG